MRSGERESRSCCNLEPTLSLSSLCKSLSAIAGRPALRALPLYILASSWLFFNTGMVILQNQEFVWKGNSQLKVIRVSFQTCVALKIRGSWRQLSSFMILMRRFLLQPAGNTTAVKTANHHPPMATFWWRPQSIWLFIDNKINSERRQQTKWTFLALPYRRFESLFVTLLYCPAFE